MAGNNRLIYLTGNYPIMQARGNPPGLRFRFVLRLSTFVQTIREKK